MLKQEDLNFSEQKVEKKYVVLSFHKTGKTVGYQINLVNNELVNLLAIDINTSKDSLDILYDVTDKITLDKYLKAKTIKVGEFSQILIDILKTIKKTEEYSFSNTNFVMKPEYIYVDNEQEEIYLLYIPIENVFENNLEEQFKDLVKKLIVDVVTMDNTKNSSFITDLLSLLRDEQFAFLKLKEFLVNHCDGDYKQNFIHEQPYTKIKFDKKIENNTIHEETADLRQKFEKKVKPEDKPKEKNNVEVKVEKKVEPEDKPNVQNEIIKNKNSLFSQISEPSELLSPKTEMIMTSIKQPEKLESRYNSEMLEKQEKENNKLNIKYIVILSIIQFVVIAWTIVELQLFKAMDNHIKYGILIGLWIIDVILSTLLILSRIRKGNMYKLKRNSKETSALAFTSKSTEGIDHNFSSYKNGIKMSKREIVSEMSYSKKSIDEKFPYLITNKAGMIEKIYINKDIFKIGRSTELVDYVSDNRSIGKLHAEVKKMDSDYYIMDMDSKNGTFINDKKLESNELYKIKENDVIKLSNCCYTFKFN